MGRHAVFTVVQDEPEFFPIWYDYYKRHYQPRNIYVLHHGLPLETWDTGPAWLLGTISYQSNVVRIFRDQSFDHTWLRLQVERFAAFLRGSYDTILFTEADEIVALDPRRSQDGDLPAWLDRWVASDPHLNRPAVRCTGYEVVHDYRVEPVLDLDRTRGILRQRNLWYPCETYSKTLAWRLDPHWSNGFHQVTGVGEYGPNLADPDKVPELLLLHLHKVDYTIARQRLARTVSRTWSRPDVRIKAGFQNRFQTEEELRAWWFMNVDNPAGAAPLVPIPAEIKDII